MVRLNGTYVNGRRVPVVDIHDGQIINIGNPDGPQLTFEVGRTRHVGRPPQTRRCRSPAPAPARPTRPQQPTPGGRTRPPGRSPTGARVPRTATAGYPAAARLRRPTPATAPIRITVEPPNVRRPWHRLPASRRRREHSDEMTQAILPGSRPRRSRQGRHDRSGQRQRHRHPGCAGFALSRVFGSVAAGHRDPRSSGHQRRLPLRQRCTGRVGGAQRG